MRAISSLVRAVVWLAIAAVLALGAGGIAVAADRPPGDDSRPELTARADRAVQARLDSLRDEIDEIDEDVERLSRAGRGALIDLSERDVDGLVGQLDAGNELVARIDSNASEIRGVLLALPYRPDSPRLGEGMRARLESLQRLVDGAGPLGDTWTVLAARSAPAVQLIGLLQEHDIHTVAAARLGTREQYAAALEELAQSFTALERAERVRDALARNADVDTLDQWLERSRGYDEALQALYEILAENGGVFSDEAREAFEDVERAQELLPPDTRALVVIMAEVAQGGLNQTVIAIETARGTVASARAALD